MNQAQVQPQLIPSNCITMDFCFAFIKVRLDHLSFVPYILQLFMDPLRLQHLTFDSDFILDRSLHYCYNVQNCPDEAVNNLPNFVIVLIITINMLTLSLDHLD